MDHKLLLNCDTLWDTRGFYPLQGWSLSVLHGCILSSTWMEWFIYYLCLWTYFKKSFIFHWVRNIRCKYTLLDTLKVGEVLRFLNSELRIFSTTCWLVWALQALVHLSDDRWRTDSKSDYKRGQTEFTQTWFVYIVVHCHCQVHYEDISLP